MDVFPTVSRICSNSFRLLPSSARVMTLTSYSCIMVTVECRAMAALSWMVSLDAVVLLVRVLGMVTPVMEYMFYI